MNDKILERLKKEFAFVGDEKISGQPYVPVSFMIATTKSKV